MDYPYSVRCWIPFAVLASINHGFDQGGGLASRRQPVDSGAASRGLDQAGRRVVHADTDRMQRRHLPVALAEQINPVQVWQ